jgi:hypothetical protein
MRTIDPWGLFPMQLGGGISGPDSNHRCHAPDGRIVTCPHDQAKASGTLGTNQQNNPCSAPGISARDNAYLDKYYGPVAAEASDYSVDPALVLGVGIESAFASSGTYLTTGDAFGMTGGSTENMTTASSPSANVAEFFNNYGDQIYGTGNNSHDFINALLGRDSNGGIVSGWKTYNSVNPAYRAFLRSGIRQMQKEVPAYVQSCVQK